MNKNEYLGILSQRLSVLPIDEYNNIMEYYSEYFEEAGADNEANVMAELGDVNQLADRILKENGQAVNSQQFQQQQFQQQSQPYNQQNNQYGGPVYNQAYNQPYNQPQGQMYNPPYGQPYQAPKSGLSTGMKVFLAIVTIPLWIVFVALIFSFGVASVSILASSLFTIIAGLAVMGAYFGTGMAFVGSGFIMIAVGMGLLMACKGISHGMKCSYRAIFKRSSANV